MAREQPWVIANDSPSNKRRRKLSKLLDGSGERLQWSVFECHLQPHQLRRLRQGLNRIATGEGSVRLWVVPQRAPAAEQLGKPVEPTPWEDKVIEQGHRGGGRAHCRGVPHKVQHRNLPFSVFRAPPCRSPITPVFPWIGARACSASDLSIFHRLDATLSSGQGKGGGQTAFGPLAAQALPGAAVTTRW